MLSTAVGLLSIKHSSRTNRPATPAPQWDNSDLIIAFTHPPKPVSANSDDLPKNYEIHSDLVNIFCVWCDHACYNQIRKTDSEFIKSVSKHCTGTNDFNSTAGMNGF